MRATTTRLDLARRVASEVIDPEMPMLTLADLGVLRDVRGTGDGRVVVTITPTYSGCPAMATIRGDLVHALRAAGFTDVQVRTTLTPAWSSGWITEAGRRKLADHGIAPPGRPVAPTAGPVPLTLTPRRPVVVCPVCGSVDTELTSEFGATPCKSLHRCRSCTEPFERVKEI
ncbi:ring-1,2-phenylacetyl-CoA epoxidase subunit PaaD [Mycobacterium frederiksbergense]|uniref:Ring-1,2-phenylacetyl-CoA epoxidase subunit PaaD n=1 Tax=Mycolicibacterium frederiksbergense TaxID=117567 RepID=A0ABT6KVT6_9MYCO|nr:1,2-phenylacetyl-CoA epoxidase subunit PaaD [Mycolicibacterium frederiksbergense]MDH6194831.1 ring-1,2-phenylacetyl-CoA epoxidase subunit PaaD [Mycolicibacterium frederiksbergense]